MKAKITTAVFLCLIILFSSLTIALPKSKISESENRVLQAFPTLSIDTIISGEFGEDLEVYLSDHFFSRDTWISLKTLAERMLGKKDINGVYFIGAYLIERHTDSDISDKTLQTNLSALEKFLSQNEDINVNVLIAPTTSYVLSDKFSDFDTAFDEQALLDEIKALAGDKFIDVTDILKQAQDDYVYYKTDHHWTTYGAMLAYNEYAKENGLNQIYDELLKIDSDFYGTVHAKVNDFFTKPDDIYYWDTDLKVEIEYNLDGEIHDSMYEESALETKDKYTYFLNGNNAITTIKTEVDNDKVLLVIKDSFAHCFVPFLAGEYSEIIMIDYRYNNMSTKQIIEDYGVSDVLVLYNSISFATYESLVSICY